MNREKGQAPITGAWRISLGRDDFSAEICKMSNKRQPGKK